MTLEVGRRVGKKCSREDKRGVLSKWIYGKTDMGVWESRGLG